MLRQLPAELFGDLKAVSFRAFGVIWPKVHIHDRPTVFVGDFGAQAIHVVIRPANPHHGRPEDQRAEDFALLQVVRDHHEASQSRLRSVRRG